MVAPQIIDDEPRLERLAPVPLGAVCFRYVDGYSDLNMLNRAILDRVMRRGRVYISNTSIKGAFFASLQRQSSHDAG